MRVFVLGGSGMVGHTVCLYLKEQGYKVTAVSRRPVDYCHNIVMDVLNFDALRLCIENESIDVIVNLVGILNQDASDDIPKAILLNTYLPHLLSQICKEQKIKFIQISTDCVFSGSQGGYSENHLPDGVKMYDRTKALGETTAEYDLTLRTSLIGPDRNEAGIGLLNWFLKQTGEVAGYSQVMWTGVTSLELAKAIVEAIHVNLVGLYHLVNNKPISKFDLLKMIQSVFGRDDISVYMDKHVKSDKSLVNTRTDFPYSVPTYEVMLSEMKNWVDNHPEFYGHYKRNKA